MEGTDYESAQDYAEGQHEPDADELPGSYEERRGA